MSEAKGLMVLTGDGRSGTLVVDGLPKLGPERQYQLWLIQDGQRTSGGVFSVDSWGYGAMVIESERPLDSFQSVGVTIEPAGGSPGPTGEKVLSGEL
jgi:anti-sigma-K factor RskA